MQLEIDRVAEMALQEAGYLERDSQITHPAASNFNIRHLCNCANKAYGGNDTITLPGKSERYTSAEGDTINLYATRETGLISPKYRSSNRS